MKYTVCTRHWAEFKDGVDNRVDRHSLSLQPSRRIQTLNKSVFCKPVTEQKEVAVRATGRHNLT